MHIALALLLFLPVAATPDPTLPPRGAVAVATAEGRGVQIYLCGVAAGAFQWTFEAPEATLFEPGSDRQVGTHGAGPAWTWQDGSSITGTVLSKQASTVPGAIPWLLVQTHSTGSASGTLSRVSLVRRSETQAGVAPQTGCDADHAGTTLRVPYKATYTFYTVPGSTTP